MVNNVCPVCDSPFEDGEKVYDCPVCNVLIHLHCDREHSFQIHAPAYQDVRFHKEDLE